MDLWLSSLGQAGPSMAGSESSSGSSLASIKLGAKQGGPHVSSVRATLALNYGRPDRAGPLSVGGADAGVGIGMGWVGGEIPSIELKNSQISISSFLEDINPMFKSFENL